MLSHLTRSIIFNIISKYYINTLIPSNDFKSLRLLFFEYKKIIFVKTKSNLEIIMLT